MTEKPTYDEITAAYDKLVSEKERYRRWLQRIADGTHKPWLAAKVALNGGNPDLDYEEPITAK